MQRVSDQQIDTDVLEIVAKYSLIPDFSTDALLGRDLGIRGGDAVELLDELESHFGVDLRPLVENGPKERDTFVHRLFGIESRRSGIDVSTRQVIDFIGSELRKSK